MLPVEVVKTLAGRGILHSVMMEFAVNKDDAETEKIQEDYINHKRIRDAKTLQDIKMKHRPRQLFMALCANHTCFISKGHPLGIFWFSQPSIYKGNPEERFEPGASRKSNSDYDRFASSLSTGNCRGQSSRYSPKRLWIIN